ncbi:HAMP domain-containing histidine kinase [Clostridium felsineum]|uniref:HAMP domain-containing sensor histidine kinase n=1 Tax=Clostridium felsineum TaxID=36839 RepID=UPI00098C1C56|nr:HAMP domain-containing sensor histidine kinase [Clostridium felsineum]MCR3759222.1 HAMP domain-containing histidine kinase [Clostridium felsineum]URZ00376.1 Adaptive-response sensory-kinase SasA [Clostridium felsineum]
MKLWKKIFICTLIVFEVFFVPSSIYLINSSFKSNLKEEISSAISEQRRFTALIQSNMVFFKLRDGNNVAYNLNKEELRLFINTYLSNFKNENVYVEVTDENGDSIFNNLPGALPKKRPELYLTSNKLQYIVRDVNDKSYLFIASNLKLQNSNYKFCYIKDVSRIYANRKYLFGILLKLNIIIVVSLIVVMIILSKFIVKPINSMIKSTQKIAEGNFSERVYVSKDYEIGLLAKNFNYMAGVIEDKIEELRRSADDKQRFIDDLTHEIRTPLTSIIGYADFLRTAKYDKKTLFTSLTYIYDEGRRLQKLSSKLMQLTILRKEEFSMKEESIENMVLRVKRAMKHKLQEKSISLKVSYDKIIYSMELELITILITNLIDNAIKASKSNDEIYLKVHGYGERLMMEVIDKGAGIPKDAVEKVMQPFYMVDKARERANNGAGIGLALCKKIVDIHKGEIYIISKLKEGTNVKVII